MKKSGRILFLISVMLLLSILMFACSRAPQKYMQNEQQKKSSLIANPASVFCTDHNGTLSARQTPDGEEGICNFPDGTWCDEWDYYKGGCLPGNNMSLCSGQFWGKSVCPAEYNPVCGIGSNGQETYRNPCVACTSGAEGYIHGTC